MRPKPCPWNATFGDPLPVPIPEGRDRCARCGMVRDSGDVPGPWRKPKEPGDFAPAIKRPRRSPAKRRAGKPAPLRLDVLPPPADIFPLMLGDDFAEHQRPRPAGAHPADPDGTLLDGRNRYRAGLEIGIESLMRTWEPKGESEVAIVLSLNLHCRHLTSSQRACVAVSILPHLEARAQERERIRKSADATPEKSPGSEQGEMVQANDGIGYDGRTEEEIEEENRERNEKRKRDAEVRDLVWGLESLPKIEVEIEVLIQELDEDER